MINFKKELVVPQKKFLSLSKRKSRFSTFSNQFQEKNTLVMPNIKERNNNPLQQRIQIEQKLENHAKEKIQRKLSHDFHPSQLMTKSLSVKGNQRNSMFNKKTIQKQQKNINFITEENEVLNKQQKTIFQQQNNKLQKRNLKIIQLLLSSKNKLIIQKKQQFHNQNPPFQTKNPPFQTKNPPFQTKNNNIIIRDKSFIKKDPSNFAKSPYLRLKKTSSITDSHKLQQIKNEPLNSQKTSNSTISLTNKLMIYSGVIQLTIFQQQKNTNKVSVEIQTIQSDTQVYQYLVYKRKKQTYENQLKDLLKQFEIIKQYRNQRHQRAIQFQKNCQGDPINDRQKRVFDLKKQITRYEQILEYKINEKYKSDESILQQIRCIEILTTNGIYELENMLKDYFNIFKQSFQKHSQHKYARIASRLQKLTQNYLTDLQKKIVYQMDKSRSYKRDTQQLKNLFNDYKNVRQQKKILLKNCFSQIKQLPQLFYQLYGKQLQKYSISDTLKIQNKETPAQIQIPKCLQCFNSQWKSYAIADKNIHIQPILKVAEQLVK